MPDASMQKKIQNLHEVFQGQAYPAMFADLGKHLGVTTDSLQRLALGWACIVPTKKGNSYCGWWTIPERDDEGDIVGLSLRSQTDFKIMYSGSKHGLIYEINPKHRQGEHGYSAGPQNWARTMDAGVLCPVCQKPDGCLVSSDDPHSPKAAVCIRQKSPKPLKFGFLHILKSEGQLSGVAALADNGGPVVVVEGMTDTAAAMDLGFNAVGRPSNLACMDMLEGLLRGRSKVIIVGENDRKEDGKEPGKEGMLGAFQTLRRVCREVIMVMPPEHIKDLRAWKVKYGLTRDGFLEYVEKSGLRKVDDATIADDRPSTIARAFLDANYKMAGRSLLRRWKETWYTFRGGRYTPLDPEAFAKPLYDWGEGMSIQKEHPTKGVTLSPLKVDNGLVANVTQALAAQVLISGNRIPQWINDYDGPDPCDLIIFANGILHVPAFLRGEEDYLIDSTPDMFTTSALPINFDPAAKCPVWMSFLQSSLGDEPAKIDLLQEWIGYCMTPDTSFQKMMFMRGPSGAGKGRVIDVLCQLMGDEQSASTSFADLSGPFGIAPLIGKLICVIPDARTPRHADASRGLELLLNISSGDPVQINRKFKDAIDKHTLSSRITIASNEFLEVPDYAGALMRRLNIIEFSQSFIGREDFGLPAKLATEVGGIAVWALAGLARLRSQGHFTVPESSRIAMSEWRIATSPIAAFIEECTEEGQDYEALKNELYDAWVGWSTERRIFQMSKGRFFERMKTNAPYSHSETYEENGHKLSVFRGLQLKPWAKRKFTGGN
jgi:P4 family phage/plasmid primase-like protien